MKNASITQPTAAENPNKTIRPLVSNASTGGGKRNMAVCFLSLRLKRTYLAIFAHQKLLDRKWESVIADGVFDADGVLEAIRLRQAKSDEHGHVLRHSTLRSERPRYELPIKGLIGEVPTLQSRRQVDEPKFDGEYCFITIPSEWRVK